MQARLLRQLTRQPLLALALVFALLSAQTLGLRHGIAHGLGPEHTHQMSWSGSPAPDGSPDRHHSCAAYEAATVAGILTSGLSPLVAVLFSFAACPALPVRAYLPPHTPHFESRAPPRA